MSLPSADPSEVYNGLEVIRRAEKLRTVALTASRENMESLLPQMIDLLQEFDEEEEKLKAQLTIKKKFKRFNTRLFKSRTKTSRKRTQKTNHRLGSAGVSDILLLPGIPDESSLPRISINSRNGSKRSRLQRKAAETSNSSLVSGTPKKLQRRVSSKFNASSRSLSVLDGNFVPKRHMKALKAERKKFEEAIKKIRPKANAIERKTKVRGSVCGVYHPEEGDIVWKENTGGLFGVWHPTQRRIVWKVEPANSVAGVYNPLTKAIEWKTVFNGSICGVYHPIEKKVCWFQRRGMGIFAVYNPVEEKIECMENPSGSVVGWFNPNQQKVQWEFQTASSLCVVVRDYEKGGYITACCNFTGWRR